MKLQELKEEFQLQLKDSYTTDEARSLFYWLAEVYLQKSKIKLLSEPDLLIKFKEIELFREAIKRLQCHEPHQYILGFTEFCDLRFEVNSSVLIPRPETEELVEWVANCYPNESVKIIDIGTGSGCIAVSIAKKLKKAEVTALDVSEEAISTARKNANNHQVKLNFIQQNILTAKRLDQDYDVVISNPPYVLAREKELMQANVLEHEPHLALFVKDENPLLFYHCIAGLVQQQKKACRLFFEINQKHGEELVEDLNKMGFVGVELKKDFLGKNRMISAKHELKSLQ